MQLRNVYKIVMLGLTLILSVLFLISYMQDIKNVKVEYEPKRELATLVEDFAVVSSVNSNRDDVSAIANQLEKSLNSNLSGYGYKFASYALELGVDPYLALAIVLEETGCVWGCSSLVVNCNNIGGQKGSGCGEYQYFPSLEAGIEGFLNNLYKNYYAYGLTTAQAMNPKYAENPRWASNVNAYIEKIKSK